MPVNAFKLKHFAEKIILLKNKDCYKYILNETF